MVSRTQPPTHTLPPHTTHTHTQECGQELFDVLSCYFPVSFTPPPGDVHGITRADLAAALQRTLTATPDFQEHLTPLLLEKLSSTLR
jgi:hypothetical protein